MDTEKNTPDRGQRSAGQKRPGARRQGRLGAHPEMKRIEGHAPQQLNAHVEEVEAPVMSQLEAEEVSAKHHYNAGLLAIIGLAVAAFVCLLIFGSNSLHNRQIQHNTAQMNGMVDETVNAPYAVSSRAAFDNVNASNYASPVSMARAQYYQGCGMTNQSAQTTQSSQVVQPAQPVIVYLYNTNSSNVPDNATLNAMANAARQNGGNITVIAYTDENGSEAYNQHLSERRAAAMQQYFANHGVKPQKISYQGRGETHKYGADKNNRRAEITLNQ